MDATSAGEPTTLVREGEGGEGRGSGESRERDRVVAERVRRGAAVAADSRRAITPARPEQPDDCRVGDLACRFLPRPRVVYVVATAMAVDPTRINAYGFPILLLRKQ